VAELLTAIAAIVSAAIGGILATTAIVTVRMSRRATGATLLYQLIQDWDSPHMRAVRRHASAGLLAHPRRFDSEATDILNFFEALAYMVLGVKVIRTEEAWSAFEGWLAPYVAACRPEIRRFQQDDPTIYGDLARLDEALVRHDARKRHRKPSQVRPDAGEVQRFLEAETQLALSLGPARDEPAGYRRGSWVVPPSGRGVLGRLLTMITTLARSRRPAQPRDE